MKLGPVFSLSELFILVCLLSVSRLSVLQEVDDERWKDSSDDSYLSELAECRLEHPESSLPHWCSEEIAIEIKDCDKKSVADVARRHGLFCEGQIGSLECHYYCSFKHKGRQRRNSVYSLESDPDVRWFEGQRPRRRVKRDLLENSEGFNGRDLMERSAKTQLRLPWPDPLYSDQWFLHSGASGGWDMRVREAWKLGVSGVGVSVSILDDGIQWDHPDLNKNYDHLASTDINAKDDNPMPQNNGDNKHGTRCAGEVAAVAGNSWCGVGVAYNAGIGGVRMLDGPVSDRVEAASLSLNQHHIDIYSASWGPEDDGRTFDGPGPLAKKAFSRGITQGRSGKGNIFIWASGNGGAHKDSCSCDGYTTSIYTLSVSSATFDNRKPWYLEECPSTIATTYSSANLAQPAIVTVDMPNGCTKSHTGTSASAPMAAGIVALALEANGNLTWRDMQHVVLRTANPTPLISNPGWTVNGVGRKVSNKFGYGIMDAEALIKLARKWKQVPEQHSCTYEYQMEKPNPRPLNGKFKLNFTMEVSGCSSSQPVLYLEHVQAVLTVKFSKRGDLRINLVAPSGTNQKGIEHSISTDFRSELLPPRVNDMNRNGFHKWPFLSVQQWGEDPRGVWTLLIENAGSQANSGTFHDWSLILYGTREPAQSGDPVHDGGAINSHPITTTASGNGTFSQDTGRKVVNVVRQSGLSQTGGGLSLMKGFSIPMQHIVGSCHPECNETGCTEENSATSCIGCRHYSVHLRNRGGIRCVFNCSEGQYADEKSKRCKQCRSGCATCSDPDNCDTCQEKYFLVLADRSHFHYKQCFHKCPPGFVEDHSNPKQAVCRLTCSEGCETCESSGQCRDCKIGYFLTENGNCVHSCPSGTYSDYAEKRCHHCPLMCERCSSVLNCQKCAAGFVWDRYKVLCAQGMCGRSACSPGQYCDSANNRCKACHSSCETCIGPKDNDCLTCPGGSSPSSRNRKCNPCDDDSYYDNNTLRCKSCDGSCFGCKGPEPSQCLRCATGFIRTNGYCRRCCAEGESQRNDNCVPCDSSVLLRGELSQETNSHFVPVVVGLCIGAVLFFLLVFACLMCKDRDYEAGSVKRVGGNMPKIPYKEVPVSYNLDEESGPLMKCGPLDGDSGIRSSESEDDEYEDTLFDTRQNTPG